MMRRATLAGRFGTLATLLAVTACQSTGAPKDPPPIAAASSAPLLDQLSRASFNRLTADQDVPLFWQRDDNDDGLLEIGELAVLWDAAATTSSASFFTKDGSFAPQFFAIYERLAAMRSPTEPSHAGPDRIPVINNVASLSDADKQWLWRLIAAGQAVENLARASTSTCADATTRAHDALDDALPAEVSATLRTAFTQAHPDASPEPSKVLYEADDWVVVVIRARVDAGCEQIRLTVGRRADRTRQRLQALAPAVATALGPSSGHVLAVRPWIIAPHATPIEGDLVVKNTRIVLTGLESSVDAQAQKVTMAASLLCKASFDHTAAFQSTAPPPGLLEAAAALRRPVGVDGTAAAAWDAATTLLLLDTLAAGGSLTPEIATATQVELLVDRLRRDGEARMQTRARGETAASAGPSELLIGALLAQGALVLRPNEPPLNERDVGCIGISPERLGPAAKELAHAIGRGTPIALPRARNDVLRLVDSRIQQNGAPRVVLGFRPAWALVAPGSTADVRNGVDSSGLSR